MGITSNVLHRIFCIRIEDSVGTGFVLEWTGKQYFLTARHLAKNLVSDTQIEIFFKEQWNKIDVRFIGHGPSEYDFTVLAFRQKLIDPAFKIIVSKDHHIDYASDLYFFGFPLGLRLSGGEMFLHKPVPIVKKGIFSGMDNGILYIDGINNKGFSGGPVFCPNPSGGDFTLVSLVSSFRNERLPVLQKEDARPVPEGTYVMSNSGIIESVMIKRVLDFIDENPFGYEL